MLRDGEADVHVKTICGMGDLQKATVATCIPIKQSTQRTHEEIILELASLFEPPLGVGGKQRSSGTKIN